MKIKELYEKYHRNRKAQTRIITENDFTYRNVINVLDSYHLTDVKYKRVLDIGCGVGTIDFYLASRYSKEVYGIDISKKAIEVAIRNSKALEVTKNTKFEVLEFPKNSPKGKYDLIIFSEVLEHLKNEKQALNAIHKLLKKNGRLLLSVPSLNAPLYRLGLLDDFDQEIGHLRRYNPDELKDLLSNCGFKTDTVLKTEGFLRNLFFTNNLLGHLLRVVRGPVSSVFSLVDDMTINLFGESQIFIIATKK